MTRVKSLGQGIKQIANPYESPKPTAKSVYHREHRSKKNRKSVHQIGRVKAYKQKLRELQERDINREVLFVLKNNGKI